MKEQINNKVTIVTGLWDMGRADISDGFERSYDHYLEKFKELLKAPINMIVYASKKDADFLKNNRDVDQTSIVFRELEEFDTWFPFFNQVQEIRTQESWYSQAGWLEASPQAKLKYYNPVVMSKMFMLNDARISNPFSSEYFYWIDAGIANTVHSGYFWYDLVFNNLEQWSNKVGKFTFISYPYSESYEIHGCPRSNLNELCNTTNVEYVCRGGFFGGHVTEIEDINSLYYNYLNAMFENNLMGTEETVFTILSYNHPDLVYRFELGDEHAGLVWPFFEQLKNISSMEIKENEEVVEPADISQLAPREALPLRNKVSVNLLETYKINLYIIGYNSPKQFESVAKSIQENDPKLFEKANKILLNNTTENDLLDEYLSVCKELDFREIRLGNLGICGGRQFIAEHLHLSNADYCYFFEDDMHVNGVDYGGTQCAVGFNKYIPNLLSEALLIMSEHNFDFLKLSFSEFYGDNSKQWAWYNVPQNIREQYWPHYNKLPERGLDLNSPETEFSNIFFSKRSRINNLRGQVPYITGDIYYSNWPQIVSKEGNKKMFLETKWEYPYEQTWMSHMFQLTKQGELSPAILLASPITHIRFDHYEGSDRREN